MFPFSIADVATAHPDKKSIIMYVTSLFQVLPHGVSLEAIQEVETLPRATITKEEHFLLQTQQRYSQQVSSTHTYLLVCCNLNTSTHDQSHTSNIKG